MLQRTIYVASLAIVIAACEVPEEEKPPSVRLATNPPHAIGVPSDAWVDGYPGARPVDMRCPDGSCMVVRKPGWALRAPLGSGLQIIPLAEHVRLSYDAEVLTTRHVLVGGTYEADAVVPKLGLSFARQYTKQHFLRSTEELTALTVGYTVHATPRTSYPPLRELPYGLEVLVDPADTPRTNVFDPADGTLRRIELTPERGGRITFTARSVAGPTAIDDPSFLEVVGPDDVAEQWLLPLDLPEPASCGAGFADCTQTRPLIAQEDVNLKGAYRVWFVSLVRSASGAYGTAFASKTTVLGGADHIRGTFKDDPDTIGSVWWPAGPPVGARIATTLGATQRIYDVVLP